MATDAKPKPQAPSTELPPSKINVQKLAESRADELASLQSVVAARLDGDFRSDRGKRRRTTAFDNKAAGRRRKVRRRNSLATATDGPMKKKIGGDVEAKVCRRSRRREMLKMNPATGFSASGDGTKRLRTHVWHAKRFTMTKLWGFHLPLGLHGRGRGSRSLLKRFRDGALIHDSSYHFAVQLEGPEDALLAILSMVLVPSCSSDAVLSGVAYGNAMLHGIGGPSSRAIAPVTYMWQQGCPGETDTTDKQESKESHSSTRRLWVWIHASAFDEAYDSLKSACQKEKDESRILIDCFSLEGQLAKLEVMGSKSFELLQRTLTVTGVSEGSLKTEKSSVGKDYNESHLKKISILDNGGQIAPKTILSLCVMDPRTVKKKDEIDDYPESISCDMVIDTPPQEAREHKEVTAISERNKEWFSFDLEISGNSTIACESLWVLRSGTIPPLEESVLCKEKNEQRKNFFRLDDQIPSHAQLPRCCPVMLLKNETKHGMSIGWSIILPLSWVKAFWVPFVSNGAHAIGLREKHWVSCEVGLPYFPSDFPDCNAYSRLKGAEDEASSSKLKLLPSAVRPLKVPIQLPWGSVRITLNRKLNCAESPEIYLDSKQDTDLELVDRESPLDGFIARTSDSLADFLNNIEGKNLLLYPQAAGKNLCFEDRVKDESKIQNDHNGVVNINKDHRLCFLRVLLHAFKEGSFEEGAVVCAPHITDIKLWTSSLESDEERLQLSQTGVKNYFKEKSQGMWELQIPEETNANEALRHPIGFVTTGFVRGSKKVAAEAFCSAVLLAHLRKEQWSDILAKRRRKEIFVLVRNLRSTAYRLAHATIIVESQEDDLESL